MDFCECHKSYVSRESTVGERMGDRMVVRYLGTVKILLSHLFFQYGVRSKSSVIFFCVCFVGIEVSVICYVTF